MTVQYIWDLVRLDFPEIAEPFAIELIDQAQKSFADETECLRLRTELDITTALTYDLPTGFDKLKKIEIVDSNGDEVLGITYTLDIPAWTITFIDTDNLDATELNSDIASITLDYIAKPLTLVNLRDYPQIDERFHLALALLVKLAIGGDMAKFNRNKALYEPLRLAAKRFGNSNSDRNVKTTRQENKNV
jgi:hypothetical protein